MSSNEVVALLVARMPEASPAAIEWVMRVVERMARVAYARERAAAEWIDLGGEGGA